MGWSNLRVFSLVGESAEVFHDRESVLLTLTESVSDSEAPLARDTSANDS